MLLYSVLLSRFGGNQQFIVQLEAPCVDSSLASRCHKHPDELCVSVEQKLARPTPKHLRLRFGRAVWYPNGETAFFVLYMKGGPPALVWGIYGSKSSLSSWFSGQCIS